MSKDIGGGLPRLIPVNQQETLSNKSVGRSNLNNYVVPVWSLYIRDAIDR